MKARAYSTLAPQLRRFTMAVVIGAALFTPVQYAHQRAEGRWEKANEIFTAAREHRARLGKIREAKRVYEDRFLRLREKGAIDGNEAGLWIAAVKRIALSKGLTALTLEASTPVFEPDLPGIQTKPVVEMKLRFKLLHEGDLLRFFEELHRGAPGAVWPRNCVITPLNDGDSPHHSPERPKLGATCVLKGLSVLTRPPSQKEEPL